ncbi:MAG TPA: hypothetical protein VGF94_18615 [Kofleriaceae bacterium]|jgi:predicted PurR-regulated permease PerM
MPPAQQPNISSLIGHVLAILIGGAALLAGAETMLHDLPSVMTATLVLAGSLLPVLAWLSMRGSRASWSFTIAITAVLGVMTLFGAPKVCNLIHIPLAVAAIAPVLCILAVTMLSTLGPDYRGAGTSDK